MIISNDIVKTLYENTSRTRLDNALNYFDEKRVKVYRFSYENKDRFKIYSHVEGKKNVYSTSIEVEDGKIIYKDCTCSDYEKDKSICKHIAASMMEFTKNPEYERRILGKSYVAEDDIKKVQRKQEEKNQEKYRISKDLLNKFYNYASREHEIKDKDQVVNINDELVKITTKFIYNKHIDGLVMEFKIGNSQMYKLRDLEQFYKSMVEKERYRYGAKLEFVHTESAFDSESRKLIPFIIKYSEIIKYANDNFSNRNRYYGRAVSNGHITLNENGIDEVFELFNNKIVDIEIYHKDTNLEFTTNKPNIKFEISKLNNTDYKLISNTNLGKYDMIEGKEYTYVIFENKLHRCTKEFSKNILNLLDIFRQNHTQEIVFDKNDLPALFSLVVPKVKESISTESLSREEVNQYIPLELGVKVFLDFNLKGDIVANMKFCYGNIEFNPLDEEDKYDVARNIAQEALTKSIFKRTGFDIDNKELKYILKDDSQIYEFLQNGINEYMQKFEVLATEQFKTKQVRQPKLGSLGVRVENNLLNIDLSGLDFDKSELKEVMKKYNIKKKYHRLKDGTFLNLDQSQDIEFINNLTTGMDVDFSNIVKGSIRVPIYRSLYLEKILDSLKNIDITKDKNYKNIINNIENSDNEELIKIPPILENVLRHYQKTGYRWLKVLDEYRFGGILADDMGLGKTLQIISIILSYTENEKKSKRIPSIVVCPSSLSLNWKNEVEKFTKKIKTVVVTGKANERDELIKQIPENDLVITSYDLLKRDIDKYLEAGYTFKYIIADEAQYIKNSNTQNARALKKLDAQTRYALTGTPIENSLSELWSIFDYIMPGYLFGYSKFKQNYETPIVKDSDEKALKKVKMMIEPFILRRLKKEVLTELPDKTITILNNEMGDEQFKIYMSYLSQTKQELADEIKTNGFEKSQIKILALLTRLRQICCHPSLFIENYKGESSKLSQCIEVIKEGTESGHKILLFSQYTSMFNIIEKELEQEGISYLKLTGQTKVDERIKMVDNFNNDSSIKVFLISLKAGGTGLNLTGADMVIHFDPWWNMSAENQATDRAYRIGQKNSVQVYKLITNNSIEEKIYELQKKKSKLIDNMLDTNETFINKLSKDDIMALFE